MNIFLREMRANRKSLIIWCFGVIFMVVAGMAKYEAYANTGQSINDLINQIPEGVRSILGFGTFDVTKATGFYVMLSLYLMIMATIHAALMGANMIAKEELDKTAEFLFVKPISRFKVITVKILAAVTNLIIFNLVTLVSSILIVGYHSKGEAITGDIVHIMIGMFLLQLIYLFIGTGIAAISKKPKKAASIATAILLGTFILSMIIDINDKLENLKYFTPFKYFEGKNVVFGSGIESGYVILSLVIIALFGSATYVFYRKRDLNV